MAGRLKEYSTYKETQRFDRKAEQSPDRESCFVHPMEFDEVDERRARRPPSAAGSPRLALVVGAMLGLDEVAVAWMIPHLRVLHA